MAEQRDFLFEKVAEIDADVANTYNKIKRTAGIDAARNYIDGLREQFENSSKYVEKYDSWEDFTGDKYKILAKLYDDFGGKYPTPIRMAKIKEKNPFITETDVKRYFDKTNQYKEEQKKQQEYEAGVNKRRKEIENWGWRDYLASDYEKQRYIDDPNTSLFGKEAPSIGSSPKTRGWSMADLGLGALGVGADIGTSFFKLSPLTFALGTLAGPTVRGTRDLLHYNFDDTYKKDLSTIGEDFGSDVKSNAAIVGLTNLRSLGRMAKNTEGSVIGNALRNKELIELDKKVLKKMPSKDQISQMTNGEIYEMVQMMPESNLKTQLSPYAKDAFNIDRAGIVDEIERSKLAISVYEDPLLKTQKRVEAELEPEVLLEHDPLIPTAKPSYPKFGSRPYEANILMEDLTPLQKFEKFGASTLGKIPGWSTPALKTVADAARSENVPDVAEGKDKFYKKNLTRAFLLGEVPSEDAPIEIKKLYTKWREEYKKEYGVYPEEDNMARLNPEE